MACIILQEEEKLILKTGVHYDKYLPEKINNWSNRTNMKYPALSETDE